MNKSSSRREYAVVAATGTSRAERRSNGHANRHKECASRSVEACPHAHVTQPSSSVTYVFHHSSDPSLRPPAAASYIRPRLCVFRPPRFRFLPPRSPPSLHAPSPARRSVPAISPPCTSTRSLPSLSSPSSPASTLRATRPLPPTASPTASSSASSRPATLPAAACTSLQYPLARTVLRR